MNILPPLAFLIAYAILATGLAMRPSAYTDFALTVLAIAPGACIVMVSAKLGRVGLRPSLAEALSAHYRHLGLAKTLVLLSLFALNAMGVRYLVALDQDLARWLVWALVGLTGLMGTWVIAQWAKGPRRTHN